MFKGLSACGAALGPPLRTVVSDPVEQGAFEADVSPGFLGLDPLVTQNLILLGEKLGVERRTCGQRVSAVDACLGPLVHGGEVVAIAQGRQAVTDLLSKELQQA